MADYTNKTVYLSDGSSLLLKEEVASGGEAVIYRTARVDQVAKIYKQVPVSDQHKNKLLKLIKEGKRAQSMNIRSIIFPTELLKNQANQVIGFLMDRVDGHTIYELISNNDINELFQEKTSRSDLIDMAYRICVFTNFLHINGMLIGDVSFNNILYNLETKQLYFIDVDSFLIGDFKSTAYTPGFEPPEFIEETRQDGYTYYVKKKSFVKTPKHEFYSMSILLFHLFCFDFPYFQRCEEDVFKNHVVIDKWSEKEPNKTFESQCFFSLSEKVRQLFLDTLCKNGRYYSYHNRPTMEIWYEVLDDYQNGLEELVARDPNFGELIPDEWEISTNTFAIPTPNPSFGPTQTLKKGNSTYIGQLNARGDYHGVGKLTYYSGDIYEGQFSNGKFSGKGKYTFASGGYQEGEFIAGLLTGRGKKVWADGSYYEGEFSRDKRHGKGKFIFGDGSYWEGDWKDDAFTGQGLHIANHSQYEGQFLNGKYNGHGRKVYADGSVYEGNWFQGVRHGTGRLTFRDGNYYEGGFSNNKRHGRGGVYDEFGTIVESGSWEYGKKISNRSETKSLKQSSVVGKANVTVLCPCGSGKQFKNCHGLRK